MPDLADVPLDRSHAPHRAIAPPPRRRRRAIAAALIVLVLAGLAGYVTWLRRSSARPSVAVKSERVTVPREPRAAEPGENIDLPPLAETDALVRRLVSELSRHPTVTAWLATNQLIRNFALVIQTIAEHRSPASHLKAVRPAGAFSVISEGDTIFIDPASYRRYDGYADAFAAIDARGAGRLYATLKPRITEAYHELGDPEGDFDATLRSALGELLRTPVIDRRVQLTHTSVSYEFADPALEALSPAQRQLLRMGPRNVRIVQRKLREIAPYLGIELPGSVDR